MPAVVSTACAGLPGSANSTREFSPTQPLDILLYDRTAGRVLPLYEHRGALHVAGEPGHEYEIRLRNRGAGRVLAVTSVDGVNVVTGRTAATDQPGYVVDGQGSVRIDGWRKSLGEVAAFFFTTPRRSYAARTGRPDDVGVIGVAMFREATRIAELAHADAPPQSPSPSPSMRDAADAAAERRQESAAGAGAAAPGLGTGHGSRRESPVVRTTFERAADTPDAVVRIYYDSWRQLVARGVIDPARGIAQRRPRPVPADFVPDP
jgi:hypothetical protein